MPPGELPPPPDDGLPVRESHEWARDKLGLLNAYLWQFSQASNGKKRGYRPYPWWYIDAMSGPGVNAIIEDGGRVAGSPLIASSVGADQRYPAAEGLVFVEANPTDANALRERTGNDGRVRVEAVDVNDNPEAVLQGVPLRQPTIAFFDPEGFDASWSTLEAFARWKHPSSNRIELLVMIPTHIGLLRTFFLERDQPEWAEENWNRIFGPLDWRTVYQARQQDVIDGADVGPTLVDLFQEGLREVLGYKYTLRRRIPAEGRVRYWLVFATDHDGGVKIMDWAMDQMWTPEPKYGQTRFFGPETNTFR